MFRTTAPAKINLDLRLLGTREDGYHEIETVFQSVALADVLTLSPTNDPFAIACDTPGVPTDETNLAWRAAAAVAAAAERPLHGWRLDLQKHVPAQAGLGGGSADAVAAARLLLAAWGLGWDDTRLADVLAPIGADVAYFVLGGTVRGRGRGEQLEVLPDVAPCAVVLVRPPFGVSTRDAYGWYDLDSQGVLVDGTRQRPHAEAAANDLQPPVVARHPELGQAIARLTSLGATQAMLSGSGSAVFGLFPDDAKARRAAERAAGPWPADWAVTCTSTVSRAAYGLATRVLVGPDVAFSLSESRPVV